MLLVCITQFIDEVLQWIRTNEHLWLKHLIKHSANNESKKEEEEEDIRIQSSKYKIDNRKDDE